MYQEKGLFPHFSRIKIPYSNRICVEKKFKILCKLLFNPLNAELNAIRHLLALVGARHIVYVSRIRVKGYFKII